MKQHETSNNVTSTIDSTEESRRERLEQINANRVHDQHWKRCMGRFGIRASCSGTFMVVGFLAPFVHVRRRDNGEEGSMEFQHQPRFYFNYRSNER